MMLLHHSVGAGRSQGPGHRRRGKSSHTGLTLPRVSIALLSGVVFASRLKPRGATIVIDGFAYELFLTKKRSYSLCVKLYLPVSKLKNYSMLHLATSSPCSRCEIYAFDNKSN